MIVVPTRGPDDWRRLLADPEKQWRAGYSAMSAALSWEQAGGLPPQVARILGPGAELLLAIPEHKVPLPGRGYPSQCDVFALVRCGLQTCAVAIEAKVQEPFDRTLAEWLGPAPGAGKLARLAGLCALLGRDAPPLSLRYQLLHRTAAAVIEARRFGTDRAAMLVQSFDPGHAWFEDFAAFVAWMGGSAERGAAIPIGLRGLDGLTLGWATVKPPLANA